MPSKYNLPFDLTPADLIKVGSFLVYATVFFVQQHNFVIETKANFKSMGEKISYFDSFAEASDGYHSSALGVQFKGGKPLDPSYRFVNRGVVSETVK